MSDDVGDKIKGLIRPENQKRQRTEIVSVDYEKVELAVCAKIASTGELPDGIENFAEGEFPPLTALDIGRGAT